MGNCRHVNRTPQYSLTCNAVRGKIKETKMEEIPHGKDGAGALYQEVKKPSAIPIWGFGAVWLLWCLFGPMRRLSDLLLCAGVSLLAYGLLRIKCKPEVIRVETVPDTGDAQLDETIRKGRESLKKIRALNDAIPDKKLSSRLDELESLTGKIFAEVEADPKKLPQIRRFMNYYLPTTLTLLERYARLQRAAGAGENIGQAMAKIEQMIDTVVVAFRKQLDALFASEVMDITADVAVMEQMMASQGLTDKQDFS